MFQKKRPKNFPRSFIVSYLINFLKNKRIQSVFHYLSLHKSQYYIDKYNGTVELPYSDCYTDRLLRLPMFYNLTTDEIDRIINSVLEFYNG